MSYQELIAFCENKCLVGSLSEWEQELPVSVRREVCVGREFSIKSVPKSVLKGSKTAKANRKKPDSSSFTEGENDLGEGTLIHFYPQEEVPWQQQEITVMGRKVMQPRLVAYMADNPSLSYTYSRTKQAALQWTSTVLEAKARVEQLSGTSFNSCLLNMYRDGKDSLSWHSDNEKPYGPQPTIGSISFGSRRDFLLRHNADRSRRFLVSLGGDGDVLLMSGNCQKDWQHSVPKRANAQSCRINLTFRRILS